MGQYFFIFNIDCIIQSRTASAHPLKSWTMGGGKLGEFFHNGIANEIIRSLALPVEVKVPDNPLADLKNEVILLTVTQEASNEIGLHSLPSELHTEIFKHLTDYVDVLAFSCSSLYLWFAGYPRLTKFVPQFFNRGSWAGDRIACVGDYSEAFPENVLTQEEKNQYESYFGTDYYEGDIGPPTMYTFLSTYHPSDQEGSSSKLRSSTAEMVAKRLGYANIEALSNSMVHRGLKSKLRKIFSLWLSLDSYSEHCVYQLKDGDTWILRNITKREYVRADVLDSPVPCVSSNVDAGPSKSVFPSNSHLLPWGLHTYYPINLGLAVLCRVVSSSNPSISMSIPFNIGVDFMRGKWAGDRFDIVPFSKYQEAILREGSNWKDVSEEVKSELIGLAEGEWRSLDLATGHEYRSRLTR